MKRSTFRRRKGSPSNAAYFGYLATLNPFNEPFFGEAFFERREADRQSNRLRPLPSKHQPGETGRQLATRLRAAARVEAPKLARKSRAKKVAA